MAYQSFMVTVDRRPVGLIFPKPPQPDGNRRIIELAEPKYRRAPIPEPKIKPEFGWGYLDRDVQKMLVTAIRFRTVVPIRARSRLRSGLGGRPLDWLRGSWPDWFDIAQDWLRGWNNIYLHRSENKPSFEWVDSAAEWQTGAKRAKASVSHSVISYGTQKSASEVQLKAAFHCASDNVRLPTAHRFIQRAYASRMEQDLRGCVVDACTAAETAISIRINEELAASGVGKNASEMIVRNANGIIGLYRLGAQFGLAFSESQSKVQSGLAALRNAAVHRGEYPNDEQARRALTIAMSLVGSAKPLPGPEAILRNSISNV